VTTKRKATKASELTPDSIVIVRREGHLGQSRVRMYRDKAGARYVAQRDVAEAIGVRSFHFPNVPLVDTGDFDRIDPVDGKPVERGGEKVSIYALGLSALLVVMKDDGESYEVAREIGSKACDSMLAFVEDMTKATK
jgi:hypothetical protein